MGNKMYSNEPGAGEWRYGDFAEDLRDGRGLIREQDGSYYYGAVVGGLREGIGCVAVLGGKLSVARWQRDCMQEVFLRIWPAGSANAAFCGQIRDGRPYEGLLIRKDGRQYYGTYSRWNENDFEGEGVLLWPDGRAYVGKWENCGPSAGGVMYRQTGLTGNLGNVKTGYRVASWSAEMGDRRFFYGHSDDEEVRNADGFLLYADGSCYIGKLSGGVRTGQAIYRHADGRIRIGEWSDGVMSGYGCCFVLNEEETRLYAGNFDQDLYNGTGCMLRRDRNVWDYIFCGIWKDGIQSEGLANEQAITKIEVGKQIKTETKAAEPIQANEPTIDEDALLHEQENVESIENDEKSTGLHATLSARHGLNRKSVIRTVLNIVLALGVACGVIITYLGYCIVQTETFKSAYDDFAAQYAEGISAQETVKLTDELLARSDARMSINRAVDGYYPLYLARAGAQRLLGDTASALDALGNIAEYDDPFIYKEYALCCMAEHKTEQAQAAITKAMRLGLKSGSVYYLLGQLAEVRGDIVDACLQYRKALAVLAEGEEKESAAHRLEELSGGEGQ